LGRRIGPKKRRRDLMLRHVNDVLSVDRISTYVPQVMAIVEYLKLLNDQHQMPRT
jgi:hypothetical protein